MLIRQLWKMTGATILLNCPCVLALLLLGYLGTRVQAQFEGDPELLRIVARANQANWAGLKTWQGEVTIRISNNQNTQKSDSRRVKFAYDRETENYIFLCERLNSEKKNLLKWGGIRKPEGYFEVMQWVAQSQHDSKMRIEKRSGNVFGDFAINFDALHYVKVANGSVSDWMMAYYKSKDKLGPFQVTVSRKKNLVQFTAKMDSKSIVNSYVFDLSKGASPIEIIMSSKDVKSIHRRTFEKIDGVWVPTSATSHRLYPKTGEVLESTITWKKNMINEPIPAGTFQPEKLGVKKGDLVRDNRIDLTYPFEGSVNIESPCWFWPTLIIPASSAASRNPE